MPHATVSAPSHRAPDVKRDEKKPMVPPVSKEGQKFHRRGLRGQEGEVECRNTQMDSSEDPEKVSVASADCTPFLHRLLEAYC